MTYAPAFQSFAWMSGDQVQLNFTVTDNNGDAVDLTDGSGRFAMARSVADSPDIDSDDSTATVTVTDATNGAVNVVITDENTEALSGDYYWEFKWTDSSSREAVVARGIITFEVNLT